MTPDQLRTLEKRVHAIVRPEPQLLVMYILFSLAGFCLAPLLFIPLYFRYHTLWYRFDGSGVSMGYGLLFRRELQLTYARMQDIHLSQNILERWLGIGTVTVQTAGSGEAGNLTILGVKAFDEIRDYLYAKMRGIRAEGPDEAQPGIDAVLKDIRDALVEAATALQYGTPP